MDPLTLSRARAGFLVGCGIAVIVAIVFAVLQLVEHVLGWPGIVALLLVFIAWVTYDYATGRK